MPLRSNLILRLSKDARPSAVCTGRIPPPKYFPARREDFVASRCAHAVAAARTDHGNGNGSGGAGEPVFDVRAGAGPAIP